VHTLTLRDCEYEDASIEVHLKGTEKRKQQSNKSQAAPGGEDLSIASSIMQLQDDMEKLQKEQEKNASDQVK